MGLRKGDELLMIEEEGKVLMEKASSANGLLNEKEEFIHLLKASEEVAKKLWDNEFDEVWNDV